jgi:hypothetical protein
MKKALAAIGVASLLCGLGWSSSLVSAAAQSSPEAVQVQGAAPNAAKYRLTAWSELGMHCLDGKDYSIFAVLPPYNTIHAQLLQMGSKPIPVTSGVTITYQAIADVAGSINTISSSKTNFWSYVSLLFLQKPPPDIGLTGNPTQSRTPQPLTYNPTLGYWEAVGIPTVPYDDNLKRKPYPMVAVVAKDLSGNTLATAHIVMPLSDELRCLTCHASNSDPYAKPAGGWVNHPDPAKDTKLNILRLHDDKFPIEQYLPLLDAQGYHYESSLEATANSGTPVLCAACHASAALGTQGLAGINPLTQDTHSLHGPVVYLKTGKTLDEATSPEDSCYLCHPGIKTKCQRGAMSQVPCFDCHGNLSYVGKEDRQGWLTLPACQMCHEERQRFTTTFDAPGHWRVATDLTFATDDDVPLPGYNLYRYSTGHGNMYCSTCHGSQHAEFPTVQANDNVYSKALQGYEGHIRECKVCHNPLPQTAKGGPHGMHTVGQGWVNAHHDLVHDPAPCSYCHGADYRGSFLSELKTKKTFRLEDHGTKTFPAGHRMNCYDCHDGPNPG